MSESPPPVNVFLLSGDLMFASKVRAAVDALGGRFAMGGNLPGDDAVVAELTHVVLDLSTRSKLVATLTPQCAERSPNATTIAYGPHVQVDRLAAARQAGFDRVLTNGQFAGNIAAALG